MARPAPAGRLRHARFALPGALASARAGLTALPAWAWLAALVVVSFGIRLAFTRQLPAPWLFIDEYYYHLLARSMAESGTLEVRGVATNYGPVYPALLAPAQLIFENQAHAYAAEKAINALLMSLVAVPSYLLARRLVRPPFALLAAALSVAVPGVFYSVLIMTENAFYPILVLFAYVLVLALERPTLVRQLATVGLLAIAFLTRAQAIALVPAVATAILVLAVTLALAEKRGERTRSVLRAMRSYWPTWALLAVGAAGVFAVQAARGRSLSDLLGAYAVTASGGYSFEGAWRWFLYHLADLDMALGIVPFAAFLYVVIDALKAHDASRSRKAFAAGSLAIVFWLTLVVAVFVSRFALRMEERMLFYVMPLFLTAFVVWLASRSGWSRGLQGGCAVVAAALPGVLPLAELVEKGYGDAFTLWPLRVLWDSGFPFWKVSVIVTFAGVVLGILFLVLSGRLRIVLPAIVVTYFALVQWQIAPAMEFASTTTLRGGIANEREWIDSALPDDDASVAALWTTATPPLAILENEIFNATIDTVEFIEEARIDPATGRVRDSDGKPLRANYAVTDGSVDLFGTVIEENPLPLIRLYRTPGILMVETHIKGQYSDDWSGSTLTYTRYACDPGSLTMELTNLPFPKRDQTVVASSRGREIGRITLPSGTEDIPFTVPLEPDDGICRVTFTISPTGVPNDYLSNGDTREIGARFRGFEYEPRRP